MAPPDDLELQYTPVQADFVDDPELWRRDTGRRQLFDRRDGSVYRLQPEMRLAVNVALATGRPLLLRGEPGSGKSSLAPYLARNLARYYEEVVVATAKVEIYCGTSTQSKSCPTLRPVGLATRR